jgi:hypothetical protein
MRLTLRTLLAWLDDTLQPAEVKEIGSQVAGSPFAQELTERIHRVTRQRRLSVPSSHGPDGIDPNQVASYLDNELDPDAVAEYEKKCLSHDVNLAEVASVHQILSLLGHKVKVPAAAKSRMYQLVKGREAIREVTPSRPRADLPEPLTRPINPWVVPEAPRRPRLERFGPGVACLLLIALSSWAAWKSLTAEPPKGFRAAPGGESLVGDLPTPLKEKVAQVPAVQNEPPLQVVDDRSAVAAPAGDSPVPASTKFEPTTASVEPENADAASKNASKNTEAVRKEPDVAKAVAPTGSAGMAAAPEGILLRYNTDSREWERLTGPTPLSVGNRLLCLIPSRATITIGKLQFIMLGESEIRILPQSTDQSPAVELMQGRLLFRPDATGTLKVGLGDRLVTLEVPKNGSAVLERPARWVYGRLISPLPPLVIYGAAGEVTVSVAGKEETLSTPDSVSVDRSGMKRVTNEALPGWAKDTGSTPEDVKAREQFAQIIHAGRPILTEVVAGLEDKNVDNKHLSVLALKSMGEMSYLVPLLSRKDDPAMRRATLAALRAYTALGPTASGMVREQLVAEFGEDKASVVGKMLIGFSPQEAANPQLPGQLVALLSPEEESVGVRELALDALRHLTGRDSEGYDPDHPEGTGLSSWIELERQGKLRPAAPKAKAKTDSGKSKS